MIEELTECEKIFYGHLKKQLFLTGISIRKKVPVGDLCGERPDLQFVFGKDEELIRSIVVDFVLYKGRKMIAGIEVIDEPEEFANSRGEKLLKDLLFRRMGCEFFRVVDLDKLEEAAVIIKKTTLKIAKKLK